MRASRRRTLSRLLIARRRLGILQSELASRAGLSQATVSKIESGSARPSIVSALRIAAVLQTDVERLFGHLASRTEET